MSLLATFWTLTADHRSHLVDAFMPVERERKERRFLIFTKTQVEKNYPWFEYLKANARQEEPFQYSGAAIAELELMLPADASLFSLCLPESNTLSKYCQASVALLDEPSARLANSRLSAFTLTEDGVAKFYETDERPLSQLADAIPILAAHKQLISWSNVVSPGRIGLLMIG